MKLKTGDQIIVLRGKDKGRKGKIQKVFPVEGKILIPGVNVYKKHLKIMHYRVLYTLNSW